MKKIILSLAITIAAFATVQAQSNTANVKLNVILNPTLSIEVANWGNESTVSGLEEADAVNLVYRSADDYAKGVTKTIKGHLKATSIGTGFKIHAETIGANKTALVRTSAEGAPSMSGDLVTVNVGGQGAKLIRDMGSNRQEMAKFGNNDAGSSAIGQLVDVEYVAKALNAEQIKTLVGNDKAARYTTNIMYTITAP